MIIETLVYLLILAFAGTLLPVTSPLRYYGCYFCYIFISMFVSPFYIIAYLCRPRDIRNARHMAVPATIVSRAVGMDWEVRNRERLINTPKAVVIMNHQSIFDIIGMSMVVGYELWTTVARKEILYYAPFGWTVWLGGAVFIDRSNPKTAYTTLTQASKDMFSKYNKIKLCIFPEGTRNMKEEQLLPFKKGAFLVAVENKVPIVPVVFSPYHFITDKLFGKGTMIASVLKPIPTDSYTIDNIDDLISTSYDLMNQELKQLRQEVDLHKSAKIIE